MYIDNETHYQYSFAKVMIFDDKPTYAVGLRALSSENRALRFPMNREKLPSGSEGLGACYLRLSVGKMLRVG